MNYANRGCPPRNRTSIAKLDPVTGANPQKNKEMFSVWATNAIFAKTTTGKCSSRKENFFPQSGIGEIRQASGVTDSRAGRGVRLTVEISSGCVCSILIPRFVSPPVILVKNRMRERAPVRVRGGSREQLRSPTPISSTLERKGGDISSKKARGRGKAEGVRLSRSMSEGRD